MITADLFSPEWAAEFRARVAIVPDVDEGYPVFRKSLVPLRAVLRHLARGGSAESIRKAFPSLEPDDILVAVGLAVIVADGFFQEMERQRKRLAGLEAEFKSAMEGCHPPISE